ncbi:hypothetical protein D3C71_1655710 [compost metagenome]
MRTRQRVQIALGTRRIDDCFLSFTIGCSEHKMKSPFIPQLLQQMMERLFPVAADNKIDSRLPVHEMQRLIRDLGSAQDNRDFRHDFFEHTDQFQRLLDIPDVAGKADDIRLLLE